MKDRAPEVEEAERLRLIRSKAKRAVRMELRDYDWMNLDAKTAWKILAMLPQNKNTPETRSS
jgi:hypothetical protein